MTPSANTTPLSGSPAGGFCAACGAALSAGARFCHRCGTPVGQGDPAITPAASVRSNANILPWALAFLAVLALVANFAGKNFGKAKGSAVDGSSNAIANPAIDGGGPGGGAPQGGGRPPDLSQMTPSTAASRLYNRIIPLAENNLMDSAAYLARRMGIPAHQMIESPSNDERFHLARLAEIAGDSTLVRAQTDTILQSEPNSLLGLLIGARAAMMNKDVAKAKQYDKKLLSVLDSELSKNTPDYQVHRGEIDAAAAEARKRK